MAEFTQSVPGTGARASRNIATLTNWAGAAISLALVAGIGIWGARLVMRDVSGVPVVQATAGPMRIAPEDPGGESADHQGLSVNDVAGTGIAADPADRLVLAPRPVKLTDEDIALGIAAPDRPARKSAVPAPGGLSADAPETPSADSGAAAIQALADQIAAGVAPLSGTDVDTAVSAGPPPDEEQTGADVAALDSEIVENNAAQPLSDAMSGVVRSLRPQQRPTDLQRTASLAPLAPVGPTTNELDAASLPVGTRLVQLGAYDSPETARTEWNRLEARFGDYMEGKDRVIQRATSGGRVFYRLRAHGFSDISDARRFCSAFVSENADCIPVVTR